MFIVTAKVPKRRHLLSAALAALAVVVVLLCLRAAKSHGSGKQDALRMETNEARVKYLASLGWEVDETPLETLRLTLPEELTEPYRSYNELQLEQGFDLSPYLGKTLDRCTYRVTNYPGRPGGCQADLYLSDGFLVAGDVVCTGADGFITTLEYPQEKTNLPPAGGK